MDEYVGAFGNRSGPRSRTGCLTCCERKVKCDETRPVCQRCARLSRTCDWNRPPRKKPSRVPREPGRERLPAAGNTPPHLPRYLHLGGGEETPTSDPIQRGTSHLDQSSPTQLSAASSPSPSQPLWLAALETSACGLPLDLHSRKAIFLYRTLFASSVDTKNSSYSLPAIVLRTATSAPPALHMVLAIGHQLSSTSTRSVNDHGEYPASAQSLRAVDHYCQALRLLSDVMTTPRKKLDIDVVLATIWLMGVYEQRFGDQPVQAITAHFQGVASVMKTINLKQLATTSQPAADDTTSVSTAVPELTYLGARVLLFLVNMDARAASFGLQGILNAALAESLGDVPWSQVLPAIHERSAPLFQVIWGAEYPTSEILYDIEHRGAFDLLRDASQLRLMVSELSRTSDSTKRESKAAAIEERIQALERQHMDLFSIAAKMLDLKEHVSKGLATTLCWVMPHYHAAVLNLLRTTGRDEDDSQRRVAVTQNIMQLAMYGYQQEAATAIARIAGPLFIAGQETSDAFQQQWIVDRLQELAPFGANYKAAAEILKERQTTRSGRAGGGESVLSRQLLI